LDEILRLAVVVSAGGCAAISVLAAAQEGGEPGARDWLRRRGRDLRGSSSGVDTLLARLPRSPAAASIRRRLGSLLELADWTESPEQFLAGLGLATAAVAAAAALAATIAVTTEAAVPVAALAIVAVPALALHRLIDAGRARQRRCGNWSGWS